MVHKCIHDHIPSHLTGKFIHRSKIHMYRNTTRTGELDLPLCRLKTRQRSFAFRGANQTRLSELLMPKRLRQRSLIIC